MMDKDITILASNWVPNNLVGCIYRPCNFRSYTDELVVDVSPVVAERMMARVNMEKCIGRFFSRWVWIDDKS